MTVKAGKKWQLQPGQVIGGWRIESPLAIGGMGEVHRAIHTAIPGRRGAFKILKASKDGDDKSVRRFLHEAEAIAKLNHPNVVRFFDAGLLPEGFPYLVNELLEGKGLDQMVADEGRLEVQAALDICAEVADGVHASHEIGVLHRDLKPANIFITSAGQVKVIDFGIAKAFEGSAIQNKAPSTEAGMLIGTWRYMAPEQVLGNRLDRRTDMFALAIVGYELLSSHPFANTDGTHTAHDTLAARILMLEVEPLTKRFMIFRTTCGR